jgi:hypothetical protein
MKNFLFDKRGSVTVQTAGIIIIVMLLFSIVYTYAKTTVIASGIRDNVRNAVIQTVTANYYNTYAGMREGNTGAYQLDNDSTWQDCADAGNIGQSLKNLLKLTEAAGFLQKIDADSSLQYSISDMNVKVLNSDFDSNSKRLKIHATYTLNIPVSFFVVETQPISIPMNAEAEIEEKF